MGASWVGSCMVSGVGIGLGKDFGSHGVKVEAKVKWAEGISMVGPSEGK